ncbi:putative enzyme related to lactoylglutathione lyase [Mucilaginibacter frigoritolerans]|uniref:Putative enzyme related to lactoylglutathione lyase n=1 Tax=Mucilaginibacter frigoritolerans TaxID=652788 RepID=A0A562UCF3_9SPHI|nr:VOC family protein [Mucilaginibacter frigoritolerans]TWJ03524.1 putative enzyme related to lactoylglutathione lyase [Mucilaginibacter frigoritolerans]
MENTKQPTLANGKICYVEIPATEIAVSSAFYQTVFSWEIRTRSNGSIAFDDGINEVSGTWVLGRKPATEPGLLVSIMVDSVTETIALIKANGGHIIKQMALTEQEQIAWFTDPAQNVMGIYQHPGGGHGKICYVEIPATDIAISSSFYADAFNWPLRDKGSEHVGFDDTVGVVSGMWVQGRPSSPEPGLLIYIMVDDIAHAIDAVTAAGGKIVQQVGADAPEITARFSDPAGNVWGLHQQPTG